MEEDVMTALVRSTAVSAALLCAGVVVQTHARSAGAGPAAPPLTCGGLAVTIVGTPGDDVIDGTAGNDVIAGLGGDDVIRGGAGEDVICGGHGNDNLAGQGDEDILFGEQGDDILDGGEGGCCNVATNTGDDVLSGGPGNDELHTSDFPQAGNTLYGDEGEDRLFVWAAGLAIGARGWAYGGNGNDTIFQFTGDALLDGGNGDDVIVNWNDGGLQNETVVMIGGNGDDELRSEDATSTTDMDGGRGHDACVNGDTTTACEAGPPSAVASSRP
jgi:Ca2+-binding RTX toxin-like protein